MLTPGVAPLLGTAGLPGTNPTPMVTCVDNSQRWLATDPRARSFDPTVDDVTNDGAIVRLTALGTLEAHQGTIGFAGNIVTVSLNATFAGTVLVEYHVETSTGAVDDGVISLIVDGSGAPAFAIGHTDVIQIGVAEATRDYPVLSNDEGSGPLEITPASVISPASGPLLAQLGQLIQVTRNSAAIGSYFGSYKPRLVDGAVTGLDTSIEVRVVANAITVPSFEVALALDATQPFTINALARVTGTGPVELTPAGITQPTGASDTAAIVGSGATGTIAYTRGTTPVGTYTMTYKARLINSNTIEGTGTITIRVTLYWWVGLIAPIPGERSWHAGAAGYSSTSFPDWQVALGTAGAFSSQSMWHGSSSLSWEGLWGGTHTESLTALTNQAQSQTDPNNAFWYAVATMQPDSRFICAEIQIWPDTYSTAASDDRAIYDYFNVTANKDKLRDGWTRFGARMRKNFDALGWTKPDLLVLMPSPDMNWTGVPCRVWEDSKDEYVNYCDNIYAWIRSGWGARTRILHQISPWPPIGANIVDFIPRSANGGVDALGITFFPGNVVTDLATYEQYFYQWPGCYGHKDIFEAITATSLPYANGKWGPENFSAATACNVADIVVQQFNRSIRDMNRDSYLVFEAAYGHELLESNGFKGTTPSGILAWQSAVTIYQQLWRGQPLGAPPSLTGGPVSQVMAAGVTTLDYGAIQVCTGSEAIRIVRIVLAEGGLTASIIGSGAAAQVRIDRGSAVTGIRRVIVEMTLLSIPYLHHLTINVDVQSTAGVPEGWPYGISALYDQIDNWNDPVGGGRWAYGGKEWPMSEQSDGKLLALGAEDYGWAGNETSSLALLAAEPADWPLSGGAADLGDPLGSTPNSIDVSTESALRTALSNATAGTRIRVAAGTYTGSYSFSNAGTGSSTTGVPNQPIYIVAQDTSIDATASNGVYFNGTVTLDKAWTGVIGRGIRMNVVVMKALGVRVSRCAWRGSTIHVDFQNGSKFARLDRNWASGFTGPWIEGSMTPGHNMYGIRLYMNHIDDHTVSASNESVISILTDMWGDSHLTMDGNRFNNCMQQKTNQQELQTIKIGHAFWRNNTVVNSTCAITFRETVDSVFTGNWMGAGCIVLIGGDGHLITNNHGAATSAQIRLDAGDANSRKSDGTKNLGDSRCAPGGGTAWQGANKWGKTTAIVRSNECHTAHTAVTNTRVEKNSARINAGTDYDSVNHFSVDNCTFVGNKYGWTKSGGSSGVTNYHGDDPGTLNSSLATQAYLIDAPAKASTDVVGPWATTVNGSPSGGGTPVTPVTQTSMRIVRIAGTPPLNLTGVDLASRLLSQYCRPQGIIALPSSLVAIYYSYVPDMTEDRLERTFVGISTDGGTTVTWNGAVDQHVFDKAAVIDQVSTDNGLMVVGVLQLGAGYGSGPTTVDRDYVYVYLSTRHHVAPLVPVNLTRAM